MSLAQTGFTLDDLADIVDTGEKSGDWTRKEAEMLIGERSWRSSYKIEGVQRRVTVNIFYRGFLKDGTKVRTVKIPHLNTWFLESGPEYVVIQNQDREGLEGAVAEGVVRKVSREKAEEIAGREQEAQIMKELNASYPLPGDIVRVCWTSQGLFPPLFGGETYVRLMCGEGLISPGTDLFVPPVFSHLRRAPASAAETSAVK